mgnify:CR=1 FL=1
MAEVLLQARELTKRFGGLAAVHAVSLELWRDRIHAVIGPNGAGKSTLSHLLSGDLPPTSGQITLLGKDMTGRPIEQASRMGLGRSYQKTNIFLPFTVRENIRLAAQSRTPHAARWLQLASTVGAANQRAERALELAGLRATSPAVFDAFAPQLKQTVRAVAPFAIFEDGVPLARMDWVPLESTAGSDD